VKETWTERSEFTYIGESVIEGKKETWPEIAPSDRDGKRRTWRVRQPKEVKNAERSLAKRFGRPDRLKNNIGAERERSLGKKQKGH